MLTIACFGFAVAQIQLLNKVNAQIHRVTQLDSPLPLEPHPLLAAVSDRVVVVAGVGHVDSSQVSTYIQRVSYFVQHNVRFNILPGMYSNCSTLSYPYPTAA